MYINNEDFEIWMQKLSKKLNDIVRNRTVRPYGACFSLS